MYSVTRKLYVDKVTENFLITYNRSNKVKLRKKCKTHVELVGTTNLNLMKTNLRLPNQL